MTDPKRIEITNDFEAVAEAACTRLKQNASVRRNLPGDGRMRIDRQLPFLCLYRGPQDVEDPGTQELVTTEASYLFVSGDSRYHNGVSNLCQELSAAMQEHFGTFLFLEIWSQSESQDDQKPTVFGAPGFEIVSPDLKAMPTTIEVLKSALEEIKLNGLHATVTVRGQGSINPPGLKALNAICPSGRSGCCMLGIAVKPIYRDSTSGTVFPIVLQSLRWQLSRALRKAIAQFTGVETGSEEVHYESLGPSTLVKAARIVDQQLCAVAESFDFLLQVTPTNSEEAWIKFRDGGFKKRPTLRYRPLPYRPSLLKRRLFDIEIERIEDPTLAHIFWEKQEEVDRQLTALRDLNSREFLYTSLQLYGDADDSLTALARSILERVPDDEDDETDASNFLPIREVETRAIDEIDHYHEQLNAFTAKVEVCDHIASGIMVSQDRLLISENLKMRPERLEPLLHHEIGTHLLTYFNGRCQPFQQLYAGLAGYAELQEGLAVLAEYLCGGLTSKRLRNLAGRVLAVKSMTSGANFQETFAELHNNFGFAARQAFVTTLRVYRGGGFTKDVIYLRGLRDLLLYLDSGHDIELLYVGKIGLQHLPYIQEMRRRGIIDAPSLLPRFWDDDKLRDRLEACRGLSVLELLEIKA